MPSAHTADGERIGAHLADQRSLSLYERTPVNVCAHVVHNIGQAALGCRFQAGILLSCKEAMRSVLRQARAARSTQASGRTTHAAVSGSAGQGKRTDRYELNEACEQHGAPLRAQAEQVAVEVYSRVCHVQTLLCARQHLQQPVQRCNKAAPLLKVHSCRYLCRNLAPLRSHGRCQRHAEQAQGVVHWPV